MAKKSIKKVVLAYSGGLDTSIILKWLQDELKMGQYLLNENVACLYDRMGKNNAAKIYREKNSASPINMNDICLPEDGILDYFIN
ncbi:MAG: hypothetical protein KN64_14750 [Sulfurovum sp. AS07-7]|nr:MAG: hypothetical protein KN64_14750 [Sulfurovum sp. AS07-7]